MPGRCGALRPAASDGPRVVVAERTDHVKGCVPLIVDTSLSEASAEITSLLGQIAYAADFGTLDEYARLLADDVIWELPDAPVVNLAAQQRRGIDEVLRGARERRESGLQGPGTGTMHVVTNISVMPGEGEVRSIAYWHFLAGLGTDPKLIQSGTYHDHFVQGSRGWMLSHRRITVV
jgi:SnoaL-like domain